MSTNKESAATDAATEQDVRQFVDTEQPRQATQPEPAASDSSWMQPETIVRGKQAKKGAEDDYYRRFLQPRKVKEYSPVYIDVRMKEKLTSLINSLQHLAPDITPTMLLSNLLADHLATNKDLIQQVAREGLKRSLENTFNDNKD